MSKYIRTSTGGRGARDPAPGESRDPGLGRVGGSREVQILRAIMRIESLSAKICVVHWVTIYYTNSQKFSFSRVFPAKETRYTVD